MPIKVRNFLSDAARLLGQAKSNIAIAVIVTLICMVIDLSYTALVNERYAFGLAGVFSKSALLVFMILFISSYAGSVFLSLVVGLVLILSAMQVGTFDFFGSYILPVHFVLMVPEIKTIVTSFLEDVGDALPSLALAAILLVATVMLLRRFWAQRLRDSRAALIVLILMAADFLGTYGYIQSYMANKGGKLGEAAFIKLFPGPDKLGVYNGYRAARYLVAGILPEQLMGDRMDFPALEEPVRISEPDVNIVFILNESIRAENVSLFGYGSETTPRLASLAGLYAKQIFSGGTMTRTAMAALLNRLEYPGIGEQFLSQSNCLFRLAQANGFETTFIYAQSRSITETLLPYMCPKYITRVLTQTDAVEEKKPYDESVPHLLERIDFTKRNFVVVSPNGAHTPIAEKAPPAFKKFNDDYDNAILYSDHIAAEVIEYVRAHSTKPTYILFTSDHGELLKGEDIRRGHGWFKPRIVHVPFLFLPMNVSDPQEVMSEAAKVRAHFDIASLMVRLMGYDVEVNADMNRDIYVNGSDLSGLAGFMRLSFKGGELSNVEMTGSPEEVPSVEAMTIRP